LITTFPKLLIFYYSFNHTTVRASLLQSREKSLQIQSLIFCSILRKVFKQ